MPEASAAAPAAAPSTAAPAAPAAPEVKADAWDGKIVAKINGKEQILDFQDPDVRNRFKTEYQFNETARAELNKAKEGARFIKEFVDKVKNPEQMFDALKEAGVPEETAQAAFEQWYLKRMERQALPESERKLQEIQAENEKLKQYQQQMAQQQAQAQQEAQIAEVQQKITPILIDALQKSGVDVSDPSGVAVVEDTIRVLTYAAENEIPMSIADAISHAKGNRDQMLKKALASAKEDEIIELLGQEKFNALRAKALEKAKARPPVVPRELQGGESPAKQGRRQLTPEEARKEAYERLGIRR